MLFDNLELAARSFANTAEQARTLAGIVTLADNGMERSANNLARLADSYRRRESAATAEAGAGNAALAAAGEAFPDLADDDAPRAARVLSDISANIRHAAEVSEDIQQGAAALAGANKQNQIRTVGATLQTALGTAQNILGQVERAFDAVTTLPGALPGIPEPTSATPDTLSQGFNASLPNSGGSRAHLLILTAQDGESFYFNLSTAGYDALKRQTWFNIASQDRLTRLSAMQAVSKGGENLTLSGAIFTSQSGAGQLAKLRGIGAKLLPLMLTTGYGENYGQWYLTTIDEDQSFVFSDGMPRKQAFNLEFRRYGEDYQNL
jgi:phage protein U